MAVHVRLMRMGKKKQAFYRIVAADSRRARDGRFLEIVGTYNPITKPAVVSIDETKITKWLDEGATPSDTVHSLFSQIGFLEKYDRAKKGEDVSEVVVKAHITERKKKTRKVKKAALAAAAVAEEAKKAAAVAPPEVSPTEAAGDTPAEDAPAE